jgi:hypothetical protein
VGADWVTEAFEDNFPNILEWESLSSAQLGNHVRYQDLFRQCVGAEPGGQLNCRSEEILMLLDRFPCCCADSNFERALRVRFLVLGQLVLNPGCASNRRRRRHERRHDTVPRVFNLTTA